MCRSNRSICKKGERIKAKRVGPSNEIDVRIVLTDRNETNTKKQHVDYCGYNDRICTIYK